MALEYRHEFKYLVNETQIACLRNRIIPFMKLDTHTENKDKYNIRSIYFDDISNTCYYENEDGTSPREKFRIRIYNGSENTIHLELKKKDRGKTHKASCSLTREQCEDILSGKGLKESAEYEPVLQKLLLKYKTGFLRPKVIVEYEREPYVYRGGNVRVTFDTNIRSSNAKEHFFDRTLFARPIMPAGYHLMEVKYDEYLPDHIYRALQLGNIRLTTFSKYYLCRKYNIGGMNGYGI